jgi:hypothetical protein
MAFEFDEIEEHDDSNDYYFVNEQEIDDSEDNTQPSFMTKMFSFFTVTNKPIIQANGEYV